MEDVSFYTFPICFKLNYSTINDSSGKANELSLKAAQRALAFSSALRHIHSFPFFFTLSTSHSFTRTKHLTLTKKWGRKLN